jgi:hypothetical protein
MKQVEHKGCPICGSEYMCNCKIVTKEDFEAYEAVRTSGVTNMFAVNVVSDLSGLSREQILFIMKHYNNLCEQYPDVRQKED